jgi:(2Fe-2S) ferredoxin
MVNEVKIPSKERSILICLSSKCKHLNSEELYNNFNNLIKEYNLSDKVKVEPIECIDLHKFGLPVIVQPDNVLYINVNTSDIKDIIEQHIIENKVIKRLLYKNPSTNELITNPEQVYTTLRGKKEHLKLEKLIISDNRVKNKENLKKEYYEKKKLIKDNINQLKKEKHNITQQIEQLKKQKRELER